MRRYQGRGLLLALAVALVGGAHPAASALSGAADVKTVRDVHALMYREQKLFGGAYLLMNATGAVGSYGPPLPAGDADAPLVHARHLPSAAGANGGGGGGARFAVLVPAAESHAFLERLLTDEALGARVAAVLVDDADAPASYTALPVFPGAAFAPYPPAAYPWNPAGSDILSRLWPVPVMLLTQQLAADARERADYNAQRGHRGRAYHARAQLPMATKAEGANASGCIAAGTCKPLGGFSVWAALPPLPAGANITKPTTLVVAQVDSVDIFHDAIQGANAPLSGLVAMLAAASLLGDANVTAPPGGGYTRQLVFVALAGEPWGFMGSRAFLWELERRGVTMQGLDLGLVDQVLEIGPVGRSLEGSPPSARLYAHSQRGAPWGDAAPLLEALQAAAQSLPAALEASVTAASASNPGIPPSSLMSFLRVKPSIAGVVLTEFDRAYADPWQGGRFDNASRVDAGAIARAAAVLTGALHRIAGGAPGGFRINATRIEGLVSSLASCLILPDPGLSCPLAAALLEPGYSEANGRRSYAARHYVGVLQVMHPDPQNPSFKEDVTRFIWNALAVSTAAGTPRSAACDPATNPCPAGQVCAGWKRGDKDPALLGSCVNATVRYVPSLSTRITCSACDDPFGAFAWVETNASDGWSRRHGWPPDAMWAESDWPPGMPFLQLYLLKPWSRRVGVLVAGLVLTAAAAVAAVASRRLFEDHLKRS